MPFRSSFCSEFNHWPYKTSRTTLLFLPLWWGQKSIILQAITAHKISCVLDQLRILALSKSGKSDLAFNFYLLKPLPGKFLSVKTVKPSSQYDASRHKAPWCDTTRCNVVRLSLRIDFFSILSDVIRLVTVGGDAIQNYITMLASFGMTYVASRHRALRQLASYCELGLTFHHIPDPTCSYMTLSYRPTAQWRHIWTLPYTSV